MKGDPDPQVTWTKDGAAMCSSEIMEVKYKNGTASVVINEVFPEDGGTDTEFLRLNQFWNRARFIYVITHNVYNPC